MEAVPQWVWDWSGSILTMIALWFYLWKNSKAWHFSNASLLPYFILFVTTQMYMLAGLQVIFFLFGLHGLLLWYFENHKHPWAEWWRMITTPLSVFIFGYAWSISSFTDVWAFVQFTVVALSIVASWGLARRLAWSWLVWLPVNTLQFFYYTHNELWGLVAIQIPLFLVSVYGYYVWRHDDREKKRMILEGAPA